MASGIKKSVAVRECIEGSVSNQYTCTTIQNHRKASIICDRKATYELKYKTVRYYKSLQKNIDILGKPSINYLRDNIKQDDKILITSPHPDDDVIGCGGILQLFPNKLNVKIAYMTDGMSGLRKKDDIGNLTRIKEAVSSIKVLGYDSSNIVNCKLPFYKSENREMSVYCLLYTSPSQRD